LTEKEFDQLREEKDKLESLYAERLNECTQLADVCFFDLLFFS
jgi:hypothetical protein